jgi:hypothetical protein
MVLNDSCSHAGFSADLDKGMRNGFFRNLFI